jgi:hypothetical protein
MSLLSSPTLVEYQPEDDIDVLFYRLPRLEPSSELIARILTQVWQVPGPFWQPGQPGQSMRTERDALMALNEKSDLS